MSTITTTIDDRRASTAGCAGALAIIFIATFALLAALLFPSSQLHGAPVPPTPRLTEDILVGRWDLQWGERREDSPLNGKDVFICFHADGTFAAKYYEGVCSLLWVGTWCVKGDAVEFWERRAYLGSDVSEASQFQIDVTLANWPTIRGKWGNLPVVLTNRRRE